jgi:hypothetical protein
MSGAKRDFYQHQQYMLRREQEQDRRNFLILHPPMEKANESKPNDGQQIPEKGRC